MAIKKMAQVRPKPAMAIKKMAQVRPKPIERTVIRVRLRFRHMLRHAILGIIGTVPFLNVKDFGT
jgi:hypothetical protein